MLYKVIRMKFGDMTTTLQIRNYLKSVLGRPGPRGKDGVELYHYTGIDSLVSILDSGYLWLGSATNMNDHLEAEFVKRSGMRNRLFLSSFSKVEENLAMYKMYASEPNGVMIAISYATAERIIEEQDKSPIGKQLVSIVRNKKLTGEQIESDLYWSAVCYKDLHTDNLSAENVTNSNIENPLLDSSLAGFEKLYGWEYEKEVRLCAVTQRPLKDNEIVAVKLPEDTKKLLSVVLCPGFSKIRNYTEFIELKMKSVQIKESAYEALVDLGGEGELLTEEELDELANKMIHIEPNEFGNTVVLDPKRALKGIEIKKKQK